MKDVSQNLAPLAAVNAPGQPPVVDRATYQAERDRLLVREKAHTSGRVALSTPATCSNCHLHSRDVTFAVFCEGPYAESARYRDFMGWTMPWYSVPEESVDRLIAGRHFGMKVCYLRDGDRVFETYWTTERGCEVLGNSYGMLDMTVYGRQEPWEDSPAGWPQRPSTENFRSNGRPIAQWSRLAAGRSDDLGTAER